MSNWRQEQKNQTRQQILASSRELFDRLGYEKTTIRNIAKEAGVGLGTVFGHFPNKASLLVAAWLDDLDEVEASALATMDPEASVTNKFIHLAHAFFTYYAKHPQLLKPLLREMWFISGPMGPAVREKLDPFLSRLTQMLEQAQSKGELRPEANCQLAAMAFFSHYLSVLMMGMNQPSFQADELAALLGSALDQLIDGIGPLEPQN